MKKKIQQAFLVLLPSLLALILTSCVHSKSINYSSEQLPRKEETYPMEILDPQNIERAYRVIGTVEANAGARFNVQDPMEELRREARRMGADALLAPTQTPIGMGFATGNSGSYSGHVRDLFVCKAIVWTD